MEWHEAGQRLDLHMHQASTNAAVSNELRACGKHVNAAMATTKLTPMFCTMFLGSLDFSAEMLI